MMDLRCSGSTRWPITVKMVCTMDEGMLPFFWWSKLSNTFRNTVNQQEIRKSSSSSSSSSSTFPAFLGPLFSTWLHPLHPPLISQQFQSSFRAVSEQFQSSFRAVFLKAKLRIGGRDILLHRGMSGNVDADNKERQWRRNTYSSAVPCWGPPAIQCKSSHD